ncbi:probable vacuolar protein-sorting-associated protein 36 at C-terminar half [Coccomyxa sp. Obi]|nr:probable vacuolar protein-sorting-associated protein 36 at C-terminar half [Coccomyxa sp. Obi]
MPVVLSPSTFSASGRPLLSMPGEVERLIVDQVDLQFSEPGGVAGAFAERYSGGYAVLTSHHIIWVDASASSLPGRSCSIPLACVKEASLRASHVFAAPKLCLQILCDARGCPSEGGRQPVQVKFLSRHPLTQLLDEVHLAISSRAWGSASWRKTEVASTSAEIGKFSPLQESLAAQGTSLLVEQLVSMGFPHGRSLRAVAATHSSGVEAATSWLIDQEHVLQSEEDMENQATPLQQTTQPLAAFSTHSAGVAGILRREEQLAATTDRTLEQAFADLRGLMAKAGDMVQLAERFRQALAEKAGTPEGTDRMDADMEAELISMGITSPVTKATAGALYHRELSRQLADFLVPRIDKAGGMMPLPDTYCLFNRARGTELISPDDLLTAVKLFSAVNSELSFRKFASGVLVVQSSSHNDEQMCAQLQELTGKQGFGRPLTSSDVSAALSVPIAIASEHLLAAEACGVLCRDDGPEGLRLPSWVRRWLPKWAQAHILPRCSIDSQQQRCFLEG